MVHSIGIFRNSFKIEKRRLKCLTTFEFINKQPCYLKYECIQAIFIILSTGAAVIFGTYKLIQRCRAGKNKNLWIFNKARRKTITASTRDATSSFKFLNFGSQENSVNDSKLDSSSSTVDGRTDFNFTYATMTGLFEVSIRMLVTF